MIPTPYVLYFLHFKYFIDDQKRFIRIEVLNFHDVNQKFHQHFLTKYTYVLKNFNTLKSSNKYFKGTQDKIQSDAT